MDLGAELTDLDPAWREGVMRVRAGYAQARSADFDSMGS